MFAKVIVRQVAMAASAMVVLALAGNSAANAQSSTDHAIAELRLAVRNVHNVNAAKQAGYQTVVGFPTDGHTCLSDPRLGGMGVHYLKTSLVNDTVVVTSPEIMIYEPQKDSSLKFVAVEYIIPFSIHSRGSTPPVLFGRQFKQNDDFKLWALHVWVGRANPSGMFADYNPKVSCKFANTPAR